MNLDRVGGTTAAYAVRAYRSTGSVAPPPPPPVATASGDTVSLSPQGETLQRAAGENPRASDPFRAYRDKNGNISLDAMLEIESLPPPLRKLGKLARETNSLRSEIADLSEAKPPDTAKIEALQTEYKESLKALDEELKKLGLRDKLAKSGASLEDFAAKGVAGVRWLASLDGPQDIADDSDTTSSASPVAPGKGEGDVHL